MFIGASNKAMKFEKKMARRKEGSIRKEWGLTAGMGQSKKEMIEAKESTLDKWKLSVESYEVPWIWLEPKGTEMKVELEERKMKEWRYVGEQSRMLLEDKGDPEYLEKEARYKKVVTRFRLGSKSMCNKYWKG